MQCEACNDRGATQAFLFKGVNSSRALGLCTVCVRSVNNGTLKLTDVLAKADTSPGVDKHEELGKRLGSFYKALVNQGMPAETARSMTEDYMSRIMDIAERVNKVPQHRAEAQPIAKPTIADVFREIMHESLRQAQQKRESSNDNTNQ